MVKISILLESKFQVSVFLTGDSVVYMGVGIVFGLAGDDNLNDMRSIAPPLYGAALVPLPLPFSTWDRTNRTENLPSAKRRTTAQKALAFLPGCRSDVPSTSTNARGLDL